MASSVAACSFLKKHSSKQLHTQLCASLGPELHTCHDIVGPLLMQGQGSQTLFSNEPLKYVFSQILPNQCKTFWVEKKRIYFTLQLKCSEFQNSSLDSWQTFFCHAIRERTVVALNGIFSISCTYSLWI